MPKVQPQKDLHGVDAAALVFHHGHQFLVFGTGHAQFFQGRLRGPVADEQARAEVPVKADGVLVNQGDRF